MFLKCVFTQRTVTQVDRRAHSARGEDRPSACRFPCSQPCSWPESSSGDPEPLKCRAVWDGGGGLAEEKRARIYYQDLWGVSYKSPKLIFNTYEILHCHPLALLLWCLLSSLHITKGQSLIFAISLNNWGGGGIGSVPQTSGWVQRKQETGHYHSLPIYGNLEMCWHFVSHLEWPPLRHYTALFQSALCLVL